MGIDLTEHIISGCVVDKFELTAEDSFLTFSMDMVGQKPSTDDLKSEDELTQNTDYPLAFYEVDLHMRSYGSVTPWGNSTKISDDVNKFKFTVENSASDKDGQRLGSRFPGYIPAGERKVGLGFSRLYLDNDFLELLWGSADGPQERAGSTEVEFMVSVDAGPYGSVQIEFPRAIVTASPVESSGRDANIQDIKVDAYQDTMTIATTPTQDVYTDCLATFTLNFADTTGSFDGPAIFDE